MQGFSSEMDPMDDTINIKEYLALFWQWAWLIALAALLAGTAAYFVSRRMTPVYQASTTVLVNEAPANKSTDYSAVMASERLTRTYAEMIKKEPALASTIEQLGLQLALDDLQEMITVKPLTDTQLIQVSVESTDPAAAALIANTLVQIFADQVQAIQSDRFVQSKASLETQLADVESQITQYDSQAALAVSAVEKDRLESKVAQYREIYSNLLQSYEEVRLSEAQSISSVVPIEQAAVPTDPISPKTLQNTVLAAVVGFLLAAGAVVAREALDDTLKTPDDITRHMGLPVLGMINLFSHKEDRLIASTQPRAPVSEAFRTLRTNVQFAALDRPLKTILVTSAGPSEGKSTVAANLAVVFAQSGLSTVLVDCDFRRPAVHRYFDLSNRVGMSALFFQSDVHLNGSCRDTTIPNLNVMTTGSLPPNPAELLASQRMKDLLGQVGQRAEVAILDAPPVLAVADATILSPLADGVLLVVQPGRTHISAARQAVEQLRRADARILGVVVNMLDLKSARYAYRYGYHYYAKDSYKTYYGSDSQPKTPRKSAKKKPVH